MLREFEKIVDTNSNGIDAAELKAVAARLRERQFIFKESRALGRTYDILVSQQDYFEDLFAAFGDEFFVDNHFGYCGIIPKANRPGLNQLETIFLLILAKMHDMECRKARSENGRSQPSEAILLDEYCLATGREKPKPRDTKSALDRLRKAGVIELGKVNELSEMQEITILPSIMRVVSANYLTALSAFTDNPASDDDQDEDESETEAEDSQ